METYDNLLPTPTGTDYKSRGPNSKQKGIDNFLKLLPTPRAGNPGSRKPGTGGRILAEEIKNALISSREIQKEKYHKAVKAYEMGASIQDLANHYQITRQAMHKILRRRGCRFRSNLRYGTMNHFYRGTKASSGAWNKLETAIRQGKIQRKTICEKCGDSGTFKNGRSKIQAHHPDYEKPLEVMWLCQRCHHEIHKRRKGVMPMEADRMNALIYLREASRDCASRSRRQEREEARAITVTSGQKCLELSRISNRFGSSLRMFEDYLILKGEWYSSRCSLTWKPLVTKSGRLLFQLAPLTHRTAETESGWLRTPDANMDRGSMTEKGLRERYLVRKMPLNLNDQIAMREKNLLSTPQAADATMGAVIGKKDTFRTLPSGRLRKINRNGKDGSVGLAREIMMLPTPKAQDSRAALTDRGKSNFGEVVQGKTGLRLQPNFVEWMMGYPQDYTSLENTAEI